MPTSQFRKGMVLELEGGLYEVISFEHVKPGKGGALIPARLKELKSGRIIERTFRSGEKVAEATLREKEIQYLYQSEDNFYFIDLESYEQVILTESQLGEKTKFLKEEMVLTASMHNEKPMEVKFPQFVELLIVRTEPGVRGDTVGGGFKVATLETGATVQVPLFIKDNDLVRIDTRTGKYSGRI
ncbi:MAG: Elongation factor P [Firmicutes bacterium]|nr:Elongation factor P [Bacillota bacterium]